MKKKLYILLIIISFVLVMELETPTLAISLVAFYNVITLAIDIIKKSNL